MIEKGKYIWKPSKNKKKKDVVEVISCTDRNVVIVTGHGDYLVPIDTFKLNYEPYKDDKSVNDMVRDFLGRGV